MSIHYAETKYGFEFGAASIQRDISEPDGSVVVSITTKRSRLDIRITKSGFLRYAAQPNTVCSRPVFLPVLPGILALLGLCLSVIICQPTGG